MSLADTLTYILGEAAETELDRIANAVSDRRRTLDNIRAASLSVGTMVEIARLSPAVLNGLSGTITAIRGSRAAVTLDRPSTKTLYRARTVRFAVSAADTNFVIPGIPMGCLIPTLTPAPPEAAELYTTLEEETR